VGNGAGAGGDGPAEPREPAQVQAPVPAAPVVPDPAGQAALEDALRAIEAEVCRRTADERLRQAARNLLDDCRAALARGECESAFASATHLARSIPAYLSARGIP
jgi:hypothetical protein